MKSANIAGGRREDDKPGLEIVKINFYFLRLVSLIVFILFVVLFFILFGFGCSF